jgi:hypothetical protein
MEEGKYLNEENKRRNDEIEREREKERKHQSEGNNIKT